MTKCLNCGKEFEPKRINRFYEKKFCNSFCKSRYNAKEYYYKKKDDPEYKKKRKVYWKQWKEKNKERYNDSCRKANREYQRRRRLKLKEKKDLLNKSLAYVKLK